MLQRASLWGASDVTPRRRGKRARSRRRCPRRPCRPAAGRRRTQVAPRGALWRGTAGAGPGACGAGPGRRREIRKAASAAGTGLAPRGATPGMRGSPQPSAASPLPRTPPRDSRRTRMASPRRRAEPRPRLPPPAGRTSALTCRAVPRAVTPALTVLPPPGPPPHLRSTASGRATATSRGDTPPAPPCARAAEALRTSQSSATPPSRPRRRRRPRARAVRTGRRLGAPPQTSARPNQPAFHGSERERRRVLSERGARKSQRAAWAGCYERTQRLQTYFKSGISKDTYFPGPPWEAAHKSGRRPRSSARRGPLPLRGPSGAEAPARCAPRSRINLRGVLLCSGSQQRTPVLMFLQTCCLRIGPAD